MAYPASLDTLSSSMQGTTTLSADDHALNHRSLGSAVGTIEAVIGTTNGTAIAQNFAAGDFAARINASNVLQQPLVGTLTGTATLSASSLTGGTVASGTINASLFSSGTINASTLGTPTILGGTIAVSGTTVPLSIGAGLIPTVITLTDSPSGTIALNAQAGQLFHMVLGTTAGNRTFGTPANATEGQAISFRIKQNSNNTGTLVWPAIYVFNQNGTPALGTTSSYNYYAWRYNSIATKWDFQGASNGII